MAEGRTRPIAALALALTLAVGCGEAAAADLTPAAPIAVPGVPALPALPGTPAVSTTPPSGSPAGPTGPAAVGEPTRPATVAPRSEPNAVVRPSRVARDQGNPTTARPQTPDANATPTRGSTPREAANARRNHARSASRKRAARQTFGPSQLGRLGQATEAGSSSAVLADFPGDLQTSGMSWALPLLAIMLPIGLCGFLQAARRS
jgi:hypothetical protein